MSKLECPYCNKTFRIEPELREHMEHFHPTRLGLGHKDLFIRPEGFPQRDPREGGA